MIYLCDYHVHTNFSDGADTPEAVVLAAIEKGFTEIGFSDHCYTEFDESYCIKKADLPRYKEEITGLKEKYSDRISILCGVEQDYYSESSAEPYDYVIGSLHYVNCGGKFLPVDESAETQRRTVEEYFGGDALAYCEEYYKTVSDIVEKTGCDIIGHFDLVSKYSEVSDLIDVTNERYIAAALTAADRLLASGKPFEINTGAISRGYRTTPYPAQFILEHLIGRGAKFILSSDSHKKENVGYSFDEFRPLIPEANLIEKL